MYKDLYFFECLSRHPKNLQKLNSIEILYTHTYTYGDERLFQIIYFFHKSDFDFAIQIISFHTENKYYYLPNFKLVNRDTFVSYRDPLLIPDDQEYYIFILSSASSDLLGYMDFIPYTASDIYNLNHSSDLDQQIRINS